MNSTGKIKSYLHDSFGWEVDIENFDSHKGKLPYAIIEAANYALIKCMDLYAIAVEPKPETDFRLVRILVDIVERRIGIPEI